MSVASLAGYLGWGGTGNSNIRSAVYNNPNGNYIPITSNTVYSHQFEFPNFNVSANTVVNITFSEYTTVQDGTKVTATNTPIWQIIDIIPQNNDTTGYITVKFVGLVMSETVENLGLQSINIMIINP